VNKGRSFPCPEPENVHSGKQGTCKPCKDTKKKEAEEKKKEKKKDENEF
jgi:hypothetical protein